MKTIRLSVALFAFAALLWSSQSAQAQQIAFANREQIVQAMPEYRSMMSELEAFGKQLEKSLKMQEEKLMTEYQKTMDAVQKGLLSPVQQKQAEEKLAKMQEELQSARQKAAQDVAAKENELAKPVLDKLNNALDKVAKENNYTYIVDENFLLYSGGGIDASPKVKAVLGIQ